MEALTSNDTLAIQDGTEDRFLTFCIAEQSYAIQIGLITEIIEMLPITPVPYLPACIKGIVNLRGSIVPVMDVRLRFSLPEAEYTTRTCIIVLECGGERLGLIVDSVQEVLDILPENHMPPPETQIGESFKFIEGVGTANGGIQLLLNCTELMAVQG
jgi:purine-binding chemotaxis protein CheW